MESRTETVVFGGGCFWCTEAVFKLIKGVISVLPGYAGGHTDNPTYYRVSEGTSGHVEVVEVIYDSTVVNFEDLLTIFFGSHDPTSLNRQGADVGEEYRSVIFYTTLEQKEKTESFIREINASSEFGKPVVTTVEPLPKFYQAEEYHRDFYEKYKGGNRYCELVIDPKLDKVKARFANLLKDIYRQ